MAGSLFDILLPQRLETGQSQSFLPFITRDPFTFNRFLKRWGIAALVIFGTYNPSGHSYFHWVLQPDSGFLSIKVFVGIVIVMMVSTATMIMWFSIGPAGIGSVIAMMATGTLAMWEYGLLDHIQPSFYPYYVLAAASLLYGIGLSWSHVDPQVPRRIVS